MSDTYLEIKSRTNYNKELIIEEQKTNKDNGSQQRRRILITYTYSESNNTSSHKDKDGETEIPLMR